MSAPQTTGLWRATWLVAAKDLRLEWRTLETLSSSVVFSLIVLVIFNFAFGLDRIQQIGAERVIPGVVWTVLAFATVVGVARSFQLERRRDTLAALALAPIDRGALYCGKLLANLTKVVVLELVVVPLTAIFFNVDLVALALPLAAVLALHTLGITVLGTLFAAIVTRVGRGEALLATLLFPAATPLFVSAVESTASLIAGDGLSPVAHWLRLAAGLDLLYLVLALSTFEFVIED